ncbi:MAG: 5'/3'-nucleotidase SurE [Deltaproteobacteria bacterium]|nr:5'/3'-nucleotidase SurE [Candidatus Zymogenaceae bacterium]
MNILISNDDGIDALGISTLAAWIGRDNHVFVVAPDRERSAASHSLTLKHPLKVKNLGDDRYSVDGTPADCINLAVNTIMPVRPDLVLSGINHGANMGDDISYSGTVSAAKEGMLLGIPSLAFSLEMKHSHDFEPAARFAAKLVRFIQDNPVPPDTLLNINVPDRLVDNEVPYRITRQGQRIYDDTDIKKATARGGNYYTIRAHEIQFNTDIESDFYAVTNGYISITPLHLDMTNYSSIAELRTWHL